jgi:hypothetical protein
MAASPFWGVWRGATGPGGYRLNARELYQSRRLNPPGPLSLNYRSVGRSTSRSSVASKTSYSSGTSIRSKSASLTITDVIQKS